MSRMLQVAEYGRTRRDHRDGMSVSVISGPENATLTSPLSTPYQLDVLHLSDWSESWGPLHHTTSGSQET